jgi:hypothetical protein
MLPGHLVVNFWMEVEDFLRQQYHLSDEQARCAVVGYRALLDQHRVGDVVYNRGSFGTAEIVAGLWKQGLLNDPVPSNSIEGIAPRS